MKWFKNFNLKKFFIVLGIIALIVLLLNVSIILINNNSDINKNNKTVKILEEYILNGDDTNAINTYQAIEAYLLVDENSFEIIKNAINTHYLVFLENTSSTSICNQKDLQLLFDFYHFLESSTITEGFDILYTNYINEFSSYDGYILSLASIEIISNNEISINDIKIKAEQLKISRSYYNDGMQMLDEKKYEEAINLFNKVIPEDKNYYTYAKENIEICINLLKEQILKESKTLEDQGFYFNAYKYINNYISLFENDNDIVELWNYYRDLDPIMVSYVGDIYHLFFHSLIVYPELTFDGDDEDENYYKYMTTTLEFKRILNELYENNYILIDINSLISVFNKKDKTIIEKSSLILPLGKKPLILSIDDLSYYNSLKGDGFAKKLVFDENNQIANLIETPSKKLIVSRESDVIPILEDFIKDNPDFSHNNAKGIISLTGYEGVFGYETHLLHSSNYETELNEAIKIANYLKSTGWIFANHSYSHNNQFSDNSITLEQLSFDTNKWENEVELIVGKTNIYSSPFGSTYNYDDKRFKYITEEMNYYIYCTVGGNGTIIYNENNMVMYRLNIDGKTLKLNPHLLNHFFDSNDILDNRRPNYVW